MILAGRRVRHHDRDTEVTAPGPFFERKYTASVFAEFHVDEPGGPFLDPGRKPAVCFDDTGLQVLTAEVHQIGQKIG